MTRAPGKTRMVFFNATGIDLDKAHEEEIHKQDMDSSRIGLIAKKTSVLNPFDVKLDGLEKINQKALIQWLSVASQFGVKLANDPRSYTEAGYASKSCLSYTVSYKEQCLKYVYANNLNQSNGVSGAIARSMGAKAGMPDLGLDYDKERALYGYSGLRIEMKRESQRHTKNGGLSEKQVEWRDYLIKQEFTYRVCYNWIEARNEICEYMEIYQNV